MQYYYKKGNKAAYLKDLYDDNKVQQNEVIQLLSMFEVAFTPKQRKNYLFYCLYHLFENYDLNDLPIVIIVDEFVDLIMQKKLIEDLFVRLSQKGRGAKIHLILATQRPDSNILKGVLRSNLPSRIAQWFRVGRLRQGASGQAGASPPSGVGGFSTAGYRYGYRQSRYRPLHALEAALWRGYID
jgi:hypothetical protein